MPSAEGGCGVSGSLSNRSYVWQSPWPEGPFFGGFFYNLVGKRSVGNPRPLAGDGLSIRSAQGRVWSTQEPAKPAVHTLVVWTAGLSTRARCCDRCVSWLLCFLGFLFRLPAGAAGGPPLLGHVLIGPTPAAVVQTMSAGRSAQARSSWLWPSGRVSVPNFVSYRCLDVHLLIISAGLVANISCLRET